MNEKTMEQEGFQALMHFSIRDTRLDMAADFFRWIEKWCEDNGFYGACLGGDADGYTVVLAKPKDSLTLTSDCSPETSG